VVAADVGVSFPDRVERLVTKQATEVYHVRFRVAHTPAKTHRIGRCLPRLWTRHGRDISASDPKAGTE